MEPNLGEQTGTAVFLFSKPHVLMNTCWWKAQNVSDFKVPPEVLERYWFTSVPSLDKILLGDDVAITLWADEGDVATDAVKFKPVEDVTFTPTVETSLILKEEVALGVALWFTLLDVWFTLLDNTGVEKAGCVGTGRVSLVDCALQMTCTGSPSDTIS